MFVMECGVASPPIHRQLQVSFPTKITPLPRCKRSVASCFMMLVWLVMETIDPLQPTLPPNDPNSEAYATLIMYRHSTFKCYGAAKCIYFYQYNGAAVNKEILPRTHIFWVFYSRRDCRLNKDLNFMILWWWECHHHRKFILRSIVWQAIPP